jgi:Flp pilus assembly protein TadD
LEVVGEDGDRLLRLADEFARRKVDADLIAKVRQAGKTQLKAKCDSGQATAADFRELATILQKDGDFKDAVIYWRRAIATQLTNVQWRMELARCLLADGDREGAAREAKTVLRSQPTNEEAMKLLQATGGE